MSRMFSAYGLVLSIGFWACSTPIAAQTTVIPADASSRDQVAPASPMSDLETLRFIEPPQRANFEAIQTWSARYDILEEYLHTRREDPDTGLPLPATAPTVSTSEQRVVEGEFHWDRQANKLMVSFEATADTRVDELSEYTDEELKNRKAFLFLTRERHLVTSTEWTVFSPGTGLRRGDAKMVEREGPNSSLIDPRKFFLESNHSTHADGLQRCAIALAEGKTMPLKITSSTKNKSTLWKVRREYTSGGGQAEPPLVVETIYDSAVSCLPVRSTMTAPTGQLWEEREWKYEKIANLQIPVSQNRVQYTLELPQVVVFSREITMKDVRINEPIEERFFTEAYLRAVPAD